MEFELKDVYQTGSIQNIGGTLRRMFFNYRGGDVNAPDESKYYYPEFSGSVDIDLNDSGTTFEAAMISEAQSLVSAKYPTI